MPGVARYVLRAYGRHVARAWSTWPELFWLNLLVAFVNLATALIIMRAGPPETAVALAIPVLVMSGVVTVGFVAGLVHDRLEKREAKRERERVSTDVSRNGGGPGDAFSPESLPTQRSADGDP